MSKWLLVAIFLGLTCLQNAAQDDTQSPSVAGVAKAAHEQKARKVSAAITQMQSPDRSVRQAGLEDLWKIIFQESGDSSGLADGLNRFFIRNPQLAEAVRLGLIQSLAAENRRIWDLKSSARSSATTPTPEPDTAEVEGAEDEYYPTVIGLVAALDDERTIPALVGAIPTGGIATGGLLKYGRKALEPVLEQLHNPDPLMRSEALSFGVTTLLKESDAAARARIGELIQSGLQDHEFVVRMAAVQSIERLDDRESYVPSLMICLSMTPSTFRRAGLPTTIPSARKRNEPYA